MKATTNHACPPDPDVFAFEFTDEDLESAAGFQHAFPTFTCSVPMCATGGGCGTWPGAMPKNDLVA